MTISINASADGTQASIATSGTNALSFGAGIQQGNKNVIINGDFRVNQRAYVSGAAVGANLYAHDRWKMAASGDTYTYTTTNNLTTITIPAGKILRQVVEGLNLQSGTYTLSWVGTAQGKIGAGSYGNSGVTEVVIGGANTIIEFGPGTVSRVQLEFGSTATPFEFRLYGTELVLCQRYYQTGNGVPGNNSTAGTYNTASGFSLPVTLRTTPTISSWVGMTITSALATSLYGHSSTTAGNTNAGLGIYILSAEL